MDRKVLLSSLACGLVVLSACSPGATDTDDLEDEEAGGWSSEAMVEEDEIEAGARRAELDGVRLEIEGGVPAKPQEGDPAMLRIPSSGGAATSVAAASAAASVVPPKIRTIVVSVSTWEFSPSAISVKKGEKVQLQLIGGEGTHSFAVPDLGMNVRVEAGQSVTVDLPTDEAGTFDFRCMVPCGEGHKDMTGKLTIE
jgi:cytochrome c oxidase subunit 2